VRKCQYGHQFEPQAGTYLERLDIDGSDILTEIEILKLHGSINFPREKIKQRIDYNIAKPLHNPYILPPIFNKISHDQPNKMWEVSLRRLEAAKNVIIVGYSLPTTDVYMQYFASSHFCVGSRLKSS